MVVLLSDEGDRGCPRAGGASELRVGDDQGEAADTVGGELPQVEVLDDEHPVFDVQDLRDPEWPVGVLRGNGAVAPGVAAGEGYAAVRQPLRELASRSGLTREIDLGVIPVAAPPG